VTTRRRSAPPKKCTQKMCPFYALCKFGHDLSKCRHSLSVGIKEDEITEID